VNGSDLLNLAAAIDIYFNLKTKLTVFPSSILPKITKKQIEQLKDLSLQIKKSISNEIGATLEKGNLIKQGCHKKRDRLANMNQNVSNGLIGLEQKYRKSTGINNLKIKHNNIAGYFIEVSKLHLNKIPKSFERRQTLVNCERYLSKELTEFEKEIVSAKDKLYKVEREIFECLVLQISSLSLLVFKIADAIANIDVFQSLAWIAFQEGFTKPVLHQNKKLVNIKNSWHPLIKSKLKDQFVAHDINLDKNCYFALITGPNMAGKTTVMREVAIIQYLAQLGSFVPAEKADLGVCDYIFSRLGAHDDIIKGQSTFMVEMSETAEIIRHATDRSLIILDEIGRGTSTYDGLSIAWSLVEYFVHQSKSLTLFSTHYHELIELVDTLTHAKNLTVKTINENGQVQFLYKLIEQGATQSFGIHVAKLAGLPHEILYRSKEILSLLEKNQNASSNLIQKLEDQLDFFETKDQETCINPEIEELKKEFEGLDLNNMTPVQALNKLHQIRQDYLN